MSKSFNLFLSQLATTNATLDYFTDFDKIRKNVEKISVKLHQLNYLIGKKEIAKAVKHLFDENPKSFEVLPILVAVRDGKNTHTLNQNGEVVRLDSYFSSAELVIEYIEQTGLQQVFKNKDITNLVDYVFGIEVGLDTNARKNRGGNAMASTLAKLFSKANIIYQTEISSTTYPELKNLGSDIKRFDFVIQTSKKTYLIETNFYNTGGSKLNEVARSYTEIAPKINQHKNFEFVWITDGQGWLSAKNKLEEAFKNIPKIYNLATIDHFIKLLQSEKV